MQHCHYRIQFAEPNRITELRRLWSDIFGDSDDYTALFFSRVYAPGRALIATVDEQVAAMLFFPARRMALQGKPVRVGYVCGAATRPEYRGRGIMAAMLAAAHRHMQRAGDIGAVLIPASESLYAYYAKSGYREYFYQDTRALRACDTRTAAAPALLTPLDAAAPILPVYNAFARVRPNLMLQDADSYALVLEEYTGYGRLFLWDKDKYIFCRRAQDQVVVDECIAAAPLTDTALCGLYAALQSAFSGMTGLSIYAPVGLLSHARRVKNGMLRLFCPGQDADGCGYMNMMLN